MELQVLDVGWGTSLIFLSDDDVVTVIDGGDGRNGENSQSPVEWLKRRQIDSVDNLILTHLHRDHLRGLLDIAKTFTVLQATLPYKRFRFPRLSREDEANFAREESTDSFNGQYELLADYDELITILETSGSTIWYVDNWAPKSYEMGDNWTLSRVFPTGDAQLMYAREYLQQLAMEPVMSMRGKQLLDRFYTTSNFDSAVYLAAGAGAIPVLCSGDQVGDVWGTIGEVEGVTGCIWILPHHGAPDGLTDSASRAVRPLAGIASVSKSGALDFESNWDRVSGVHGYPIYSTAGTCTRPESRLKTGKITIRVSDERVIH